MAFKPTKLKGGAEEVNGKAQLTGSLGVSDRDPDRQTIGTVILPVPGGIQDSQSVSWNKDEMDPMKLALANIALTGIEEGIAAGAQRGGEQGRRSSAGWRSGCSCNGLPRRGTSPAAKTPEILVEVEFPSLPPFTFM